MVSGSAITGLTSLNADTTAAQIIAGTTNRITVGTASGPTTLDIGTDIVTLTGTQTLTNKTLTPQKRCIIFCASSS